MTDRRDPLDLPLGIAALLAAIDGAYAEPPDLAEVEVLIDQHDARTVAFGALAVAALLGKELRGDYPSLRTYLAEQLHGLMFEPSTKEDS